MFHVGTGELLLVVVVALLVLHPQDVPRLMRTLGAAVSFLRQQTVALQRMLMHPCDDEFDGDRSTADADKQHPKTAAKDLQLRQVLPCRYLVRKNQTRRSLVRSC